MAKKEKIKTENQREDNMNKVDGLLKDGKIDKNLHETISLIPNPDKQRRVLETLDRRLAARGGSLL